MPRVSGATHAPVNLKPHPSSDLHPAATSRPAGRRTLALGSQALPDGISLPRSSAAFERTTASALEEERLSAMRAHLL